jgi:peptidoglycan/xylan/chitin deacetylase (PgdA/CDA1 family)
MSLKELTRMGLSQVIVGTGVARLGRTFCPKNGAIIFSGHRVADDDEGGIQGLKPSWLAEQLDYLSRHYHFLPLSKLIDYYERCESIPPNSVAMTFDDGFRDNFTNLYPILQRYHVPATVFLATGCVSSGDLPMPQKIDYLFLKTRVDRLCHITTKNIPVPLKSPRDRNTARMTARKVLGHMPRVERIRCITELSELLQVEIPRDRMLTWDQVKTMQEGGIEFGAHSFSHPWLPPLSPEEARWEMEASLHDIQHHCGIERPPFVFPANRFTSDLVKMAISVGFRAVFQTRYSMRVNQIGVNDQFSLSRVGLSNVPGVMLEAELDGPFHALRGLYRSLKTGV